jgi:hypothetical protein
MGVAECHRGHETPWQFDSRPLWTGISFAIDTVFLLMLPESMLTFVARGALVGMDLVGASYMGSPLHLLGGRKGI